VETIQVVLDKELLTATDRVARERKVNRSAVVRTALRQHLKRLRIQDMERLDRRGYEGHADTSNEVAVWERDAAWPEDWP